MAMAFLREILLWASWFRRLARNWFTCAGSERLLVLVRRAVARASISSEERLF